MRHFSIVICLLLSQLTAQAHLQTYQQQYEAMVSYQKMIVVFNTPHNLVPNKDLLYGFPFVRHTTLVPNTKWAVIYFNKGTTKQQFYHYKNIVQQQSSVDYCSVYLQDPNNIKAQRGILNELFVKLKKQTDLSVLEKYIAEVCDKTISPVNILPNLFKITINKNSAYSALDIAISCHNSGLFEYAEPNYLLHPLVATNDELYSQQWPLENTGLIGNAGADMGIVGAWWYGTGSPDVKVAILDSGTDLTHPDLVDNLLPGYDATGAATEGNPIMNIDSDAHGTACAGIVAAMGNNEIGIAGVAYTSKIIPIRVFYYIDTLSLPGFGNVPYSTSEWMANAFTWAWQTANADIMSNSWGLPTLLLNLLPGDPAIAQEAIEAAIVNGRNGKGTPILFSSGNDGTPPIWPSNMLATIAVNATSFCDERKSLESCDGEPWEGNWGDRLDIGAPGVSVPATDYTGNLGFSTNNYTTSFNGTSAACPNAAGVIALMLSINPDLSGEQARDILCSTAAKVGGYAYDSIGVYGAWSPELGYGRVNCSLAIVEALLTEGTPLSTISYQVAEASAWQLQQNVVAAGSFFRLQQSELYTQQQTQNEPTHLMLHNAQGQLVMQHHINSTNMYHDIVVPPTASKGVYIVSIATQNKVFGVGKLVVW